MKPEYERLMSQNLEKTKLEKGTSLKKRPMTPAERAKRYRERRKLRALGLDIKPMACKSYTNNELRRTSITTNCSMFPEEHGREINERCCKDASEHLNTIMDDENTTRCSQEERSYESSKNIGIVIKIEPGLTNVVHQADITQDVTNDYIIGRNRLREDVSEPLDDNIIFCKQEENENHLNSENTSIDIKVEPGVTDYVFQSDVSQDDTKDPIAGCSRLKEGDSSSLSCNNNEKATIVRKTKTGAERQKKYRDKMRALRQQSKNIPITTESWKQWEDNQPVSEVVVNERKKPMTPAERKRKSREKKRAEAEQSKNTTMIATEIWKQWKDKQPIVNDNINPAAAERNSNCREKHCAEVEIEPVLKTIAHQAHVSCNNANNVIGGCNQLKEDVSKLVHDNSTFFKPDENEEHLNSKNTSINIKVEPGLTDYVQSEMSQDDTRDPIAGCSRLKEGVSELLDYMLEVYNTTPFNQDDGNDRNFQNTGKEIKGPSSYILSHGNYEKYTVAQKTTKTGAERQKKYRDKIRALRQQTENIPMAANESWNQWKDDQTIAEPVVNERKKPMTPAERKRKSREKQRAEAEQRQQLKKMFIDMYVMRDDCQVFGDFIASELRNLKSDNNQRKLKRIIQRIILEVSKARH